MRGGVILTSVAITVVLAGCGSSVAVTPLCTKPSDNPGADRFTRSVSLVTLPYELRYGDISIGCGQRVRTGQDVAIQYTGWLADGSEFDSSRSPGRQPFVFALGEQAVLQGLDFGVMGMRVGGQRRIVVPPALGYGAQGVPPVIPRNATLTIDVQLIAAG